MTKYSVVRAILIVILGLALIPAGVNAEEYRALWVDAWHDGMWNSTQVDTMLDYAQTGNYNVIVPQVRRKSDVGYISTYGGPNGTGEPKISAISGGFEDPLAYMIQQAHLRGIEVHAWICTHRVTTLPRPGYPSDPHDWFYDTHQNWLTRDSSGNLVYSEGHYLDPGVPDGEEYTVNVILDLVTRYEIDGIQWDRIRYPGSNSGYNTIARNRYLAEGGDFSDWRRKQLNNFVARVYAQIMEVRPDVCVGANTWMDTASGVSTYFQDAPTWMAGHWLDIDVPMNYTSSNNSFNTYLNTHLNNRNGRYVYSGHNVGSTTQPNAVQQILNARSYNSSYGIPWGEQCYSYYHGTVTIPGWFAYVSAAGRPYQFADTIPALPWKTNGTNTIILGRITDASHPNDPVYHDWINRAIVRLYHAGPPEIDISTETDQTGYFVFTDVTPKPQSSGYTVTISKSGFPTRTFTNQAIAAGQVLRIDAELGTWNASSPSGKFARRWALFSLPYEPVNPDPAVVFSDLWIDALLKRHDRNLQGTVMYNEADPARFGNLSLDQGYWLWTGTAYTAQYQAYGKTSASRTQSLPRAGWNIIGCPFDTERPWADQTITNGTTTLSMQEARDNGLVYSLGTWFDSVVQGTRFVGLPDDDPNTTNLQPWHGVWFKTFVGNLTLTQR